MPVEVKVRRHFNHVSGKLAVSPAICLRRA
jgi:hypothetical protein